MIDIWLHIDIEIWAKKSAKPLICFNADPTQIELHEQFEFLLRLLRALFDQGTKECLKANRNQSYINEGGGFESIDAHSKIITDFEMISRTTKRSSNLSRLNNIAQAIRKLKSRKLVTARFPVLLICLFCFPFRHRLQQSFIKLDFFGQIAVWLFLLNLVYFCRATKLSEHCLSVSHEAKSIFWCEHIFYESHF